MALIDELEALMNKYEIKFDKSMDKLFLAIGDVSNRLFRKAIKSIDVDSLYKEYKDIKLVKKNEHQFCCSLKDGKVAIELHPYDIHEAWGFGYDYVSIAVEAIFKDEDKADEFISMLGESIFDSAPDYVIIQKTQYDSLYDDFNKILVKCREYNNKC